MLSPIKTNLAEKLKDKGYRHRFFRGRAQDEIAAELKLARKKRHLKQKELERLSGMKQSAISRIEQASYSKWNFATLLKLAEALDLRVRVKFEYAEDVIREYQDRELMAHSDAGSMSGEVAAQTTPPDENSAVPQIGDEKAYSTSEHRQPVGI